MDKQSQFLISTLPSFSLTMNFPSFIIIVLSLSISPISAHFYPNISSIPPNLLPNTTAGAWESFQKLAGCHAGDKVIGLAKLKAYFHYFGYINKSSDNYTEEFDEMLQTAIRTYQLNFNLNSTGELDESTLKQITRPRCGVADLVNGTSTMNSGRAPSSSSIHAHTVAHYSFFPGRPRWPPSRRDLTYAFLPDNQLTDQVRLVFSNAFDRWSEVTPLTFTETEIYFSADIRIAFFSGDHGDGEPFDGTLGTLAHAFSPPNGRLHLDGDEDWVIDGSIVTSSGFAAIDLESVAVHEIGHILGLGHSSVENSIMFPTISSGSRKVELDTDDIEGVQVLYGSNPNYTGPTNPTARERDTNAAHFMSTFFSPSFLLVLGLASFLL